jgi:hypothetical protein
MKMYSNDSVTKEYVDNAITEAIESTTHNTADAVSSLDEKQNAEIKKLKMLVLISFVSNLVLATALAYFL